MIYSTWTVSCDNAREGTCQTRSVMGIPNQDKKEVILKAMHGFGFSTVKITDAKGFSDYFLLCPDCVSKKRYPKS